jgi:protocatechuate 3,4-dioxygenase beta subunit
VSSSEQQLVDAEIATIAAAHADALAAGSTPGAEPRLDYPPYRATRLRHPNRPAVPTEFTPAERSRMRMRGFDPADADLTVGGEGEAIGERIIVTGRVLDTRGLPLPGRLVEVWQANAAGRYRHAADVHDAPLDPNFTGSGRCLTRPDGEFTFTTIKPGPYPWRNHENAWRPAHIHFSVLGWPGERLITQMYFPGDPLLDLDPIAQSVVDPAARQRLIARYDPEVGQPGRATGYRWDIVLGGPPGGLW